MSMRIEDVRAKTTRSKELLELARNYAKQAEALSVDDPKRKWLEEEAQRLIGEARTLTAEAKEQLIRYK